MTNSFSRRKFLALAGAAASGAVLAACSSAPKTPVPYVLATPTLRSPDKLEGETALERLTLGNVRYVTNRSQYPGQTAERRAQVAQSQSPFAAILCCSDSRVPPEVIFDQGLSDLFVVRVAGNVLDDAILGSLEYGVEHLGIRLIMVLGHSKCGAVRAALEASYLGAEAPEHIDSLVRAIEPAVEEAQKEAGDPWLNAILANIQWVVAGLEDSEPILAEVVEAKEVLVVGALYDLDSGWVQVLSSAADEEEK